MHPRLEQGEAGLAGLLGGEHGGIGVAQQHLDGVVGAADGDADRAGHPYLTAVHRHGLPQHLQDALGDHLHVHHLVHVFQEHRELVTPEAGAGVGLPQTVHHPLSHRAQQPVPRFVAQTVVHRLEIVQIDVQDRHCAVAAPGTQQGMLHPVGEQEAVGEPGERVVGHLVLEAFFERGALGDVAGGEHHPCHAGIVQQVDADDVHRPPAGPPMLEAQLPGAGPAGVAGQFVEQPPQQRAVFGVSQLHHPLPYEVLRLVSEDGPGGGAGVAQPPAGVDHQDHVGGVLHQGAEAPLTALQRLPHVVALPDEPADA